MDRRQPRSPRTDALFPDTTLFRSQSFPLLAVPFFVLAGHMMNRTGITVRLIACSNVLVSWMAGGLAQVCIVLSTLMGGVSGSAVADAALEARIARKSVV